jgi:hypothetical protein
MLSLAKTLSARKSRDLLPENFLAKAESDQEYFGSGDRNGSRIYIRMDYGSAVSEPHV